MQLILARHLLDTLQLDPINADTCSSSTTIRAELHPGLAATLTSSPKDAQRLWLLLVTIAKFAAAVGAERLPEGLGWAASTLHSTAWVAAAALKALPASGPARAPACMLLGRCLAGLGTAAAAAPAAEEWPRQMSSNCLAMVRVLAKELAAPGILPAALAVASSSSSGTDSSEAAPELLVQLEAQQAALEEALAAAPGGTTSMQPVFKQMQAYGMAVCALLPRPYCCNNPCCTSFAGHSELLLGHLKCGACKAAAFCSRECQRRAWQAHKPVCEVIAAARAVVRAVKKKKH